MVKVVDVTDSNYIGKAIRITRYKDAEILNLSMENKDVTFYVRPVSSYTSKKVNRWAYFRDGLVHILIDAIKDHRSIDILVYRYRIESEGEDGKSKFDLKDVIVTATLNEIG